MDIESGEAGSQTKHRPNLVVHAGKIGPVREVESLCRELHHGLLADLVLPGQAGVEVDIIGAQASSARCADGTLVGCVIVAVDFSSGKQIKRMPAVIAHNRRELEAGENFLFLRAVKHPGDDDFVALIELGEASIEIDIGGILRAIVAVEIGGGIESLAKGVIGKQGEVSAETFL